MHEIIRPGLILFLVTAIAAACLGAVYGITKEPIERQQLLTRNTAMRELLPEAEDFIDNKELADGLVITSCFTGISGSDKTGYVIGTTSTGYDGAIEMMVALDLDGIIRGIKIVNHSETPGLGANAKNADFTDQFVGKSGVVTLTKTQAEGSIQAITSATITSRAVVSGANAATTFFEENLRGGE